MACPDLQIIQGGTTVTFTPRHAEELQQAITSLAPGKFTARNTTGDLITQTVFTKHQISIKGRGEIPNGLLLIDFSADFTIYTSITNHVGGLFTRHGTTFTWSEVSGVFVPGGAQESSNYIRLDCHAKSYSVGNESGGFQSFSLDAEEI